MNQADHAAALWTALRRHSDHLGGRPLQLFIGPSADAACAARSLTRLMAASCMKFDGHPVTQMQHIRELAQAHIDNSLEDDDNDVYIFVGCGATTDVTSLLNMSRVTACFIIDAQRPMHLANLRHPKITVWNPDKVAYSVTRFFAYHARRSSGVAAAALRRHTERNTVAPKRRLQSPRRKESSQRRRKQPKADHGDQEDESDGDAQVPHRPHNDDDFSNITTSSDDEESLDEEDDDGLDSPGIGLEHEDDDAMSQDLESNARVDEEDLETAGPAGQRVDWRSGAVPPQLERLYYSTRWFDQSAAMCMFDLALTIGQLSDSILWNASIGIADLVRRQGLTNAAYEVEYHKLAQAVHQSAASRRTLQLSDVTNDGNNGVRSTGYKWRLKVSFDDALFCLQHTSLESALGLDPVLAARLRVHRPGEGRIRMEELFAHVGVSHEKARRKWMNEGPKERGDILRRLNEELLRLGIIDSSVLRSRPVVAKAVGTSAEISPFDACAVFYAESTCPPGLRSAYSDPIKLREHERRQFWRAYDVLDASPTSKEFGEALELALQAAEAVSACTAEIFGKAGGGIVATHHVQYTLLGGQGGGIKVADELWHPTRLAMLAENLAYALAAEHRHHRRRPMLIGCPKPSGLPGGAPSNAFTVVCALPDVLGTTDVSAIVGAIAAGRLDVEDEGATQEHLDPLITSADGHSNALSFLEAVHLRLAR